jgi:RND family efflux transporter MFP subunit
MRIKTFSSCLLATCLLLTGCKERRTEQTALEQPASVSTFLVSRTKTPRMCEVPGTIVPREKAVVSARATGIVSVADFSLGERVKKGQIIVTISAPEMTSRVEQAQGALDKARRDHQREASLLEKGASTSQTVHEMEERLRIAEAALAEAKTLESYTRVDAPFDGRITQKRVNAGDYAATGTPLFEIEGYGGLRVEASVPESFPDVEIGTKMKIDADGRESEGVLAEFSPAADSLSRTRMAKVDVTGATDLRSGQYVRLMWPVGTFDEILIPKHAVSSFGQIQRVYILENSRALLRIVRTGENRGEFVQVLSGLNGGETIMDNPPDGIENGQAVEAR